VDGSARDGWISAPAQDVATVIYSARALEHIDRALQSLRDRDPKAAGRAAQLIQSAVMALAAHPLLGRRVEGEIRELIISYGHSGYVALYRFSALQDEARILAIRHQRELGFLP
jgi:plasmid stabilization system protein ParE